MTHPPRPASAVPPIPTPPQRGDSGAQRVLGDLFAAVDGWDVRRDPEDRWLAGACAGLARRWNIDPVVVRVGLVVLTLLSGIGVVAYVVAWMLMPRADGPSVAEAFVERRGSSWTVVAALAAVPVLALMVTVGSGNGLGGDFVMPAWLSLLVLAGLALYARSLRSGARGPRGGRGTATNSVSAPGSPEAVAFPEGPTGENGTPVVIRPFPDAGTVEEPAAPAGTFTQIPTGVVGVATPAFADAPRTPPPPLRAAAAIPAPGAARAARVERLERRRPPRRRRAGSLAVLGTMAAVLITYGLALLLPRQAGWEGVHPQVVAFAAALAVSALALALVGMAGRKGGLITLLSLALAAGLALSADPTGGHWRDGMGESVWVPTATTGTAYDLGVGKATLDLSRFPQSPAGSPPTLTARLGVGELIVSIPSGLTVTVNARAGLGAIDDNGAARSPAGEGREVSLTKTFGSGPPDLVVDASVDLGQITIRKAS